MPNAYGNDFYKHAKKWYNTLREHELAKSAAFTFSSMYKTRQL